MIRTCFSLATSQRKELYWKILLPESQSRTWSSSAKSLLIILFRSESFTDLNKLHSTKIYTILDALHKEYISASNVWGNISSVLLENVLEILPFVISVIDSSKKKCINDIGVHIVFFNSLFLYPWIPIYYFFSSFEIIEELVTLVSTFSLKVMEDMRHNVRCHHLKLSFCLALSRIFSYSISSRKGYCLWCSERRQSKNESCHKDERLFQLMFTCTNSLVSESMQKTDDTSINCIYMIIKANGILQMNFGPHILTVLTSLKYAVHDDEILLDLFDVLDEIRSQFPVLLEYGVSESNSNHSNCDLFDVKKGEKNDASVFETLHYQWQLFDDIAGRDLRFNSINGPCQYLPLESLKNIFIPDRFSSSDGSNIEGILTSLSSRIYYKSIFHIINAGLCEQWDIFNIVCASFAKFGWPSSEDKNFISRESIQIGFLFLTLLEVSFQVFDFVSGDFYVSFLKLFQIILSKIEALFIIDNVMNERFIINIYQKLMRSDHLKNHDKSEIMVSLSGLFMKRGSRSSNEICESTDDEIRSVLEISRVCNTLRNTSESTAELLYCEISPNTYTCRRFNIFLGIVAVLNHHHCRHYCAKKIDICKVMRFFSSSILYTRDKIIDYDIYRSVISSMLVLIEPHAILGIIEILSEQMKLHFCTNAIIYSTDIELYVTLVSLTTKFAARIEALDAIELSVMALISIIDMSVTIPYYQQFRVNDYIIFFSRLSGYFMNMLRSLNVLTKQLRRNGKLLAHFGKGSDKEALLHIISVSVLRGLLQFIQLSELCTIVEEHSYHCGLHFCHAICGKINRIFYFFGECIEVNYVPIIFNVFRKLLRSVLVALTVKPPCKKCCFPYIHNHLISILYYLL